MPLERTVATNRKARHDYHIEESFEAGIVLTGSEIKSVRAGRVNLQDSYAIVRDGELWLINSHIALYDPASRQNHEPRRNRKLLMHRSQINRQAGQVRERGYTLIPLRMYLRGGRAKVELSLARGKRKYDKRQTIAEREAGRQIERALKERTRKQRR